MLGLNLWSRRDAALKRKEELSVLEQEKLYLIREIEIAHRDWVNAQHRFEYVLGNEQVDYAIYAMEAAEKRYELLIKQAKMMKMSRLDVGATVGE